MGLECAETSGPLVRRAMFLPVVGGVDAEKFADVGFRAAGQGSRHDELVLREECRGLCQPQHRVVGRTQTVQRPFIGLHRVDAVFGTQMGERRAEVRGVFVGGAEGQQP